MNVRATRRPARQVPHVVERAAPGAQVLGAGPQLARLVGADFLARVRERQRARQAHQGSIA